LGGEITKTPEKASKLVPKKTNLVNQQPPQPSTKTNPKPTQTQTLFSIKQMIIPKFVVEPSVSIVDSEPIQNPTLTTTDKPSSSSSPSIQTLKQTPPNLLESEFLETEMLEISNDLQRLVQLRRSPTLSVAYEEKWATLKTRASELLNSVSQKCIKIQAAAYKHHFSTVHSVEEDQAPLLYLANTPYFPESDYVTREAKMFKLLKQKVLKQQEDAKAREDLLLQRQLELEAALKEQAAVIAQLMNKQPNP